MSKAVGVTIRLNRKIWTDEHGQSHREEKLTFVPIDEDGNEQPWVAIPSPEVG